MTEGGEFVVYDFIISGGSLKDYGDGQIGLPEPETDTNQENSGLFPEEIKDSINFNLLIVLSSVTFDLISTRDSLSFFCSFFKSKLTNISLTASAPIPAVNASSPNSS